MLFQLRALRREQLVAEPELGFLLRIRLPEGNCVQRRFSEGMDISVIIGLKHLLQNQFVIFCSEYLGHMTKMTATLIKKKYIGIAI